MKKPIAVMAYLSAMTTLLSTGDSQAQTNIDLFTDTQVISDSTADASSVRSNVTAGSIGNILGGERDVSVFLDTLNPPSGGVVMTITGGILAFANSPGAAGVGIVQWDGVDAADNGGHAANFGELDLDETGLGGIDLKAVANAFVFQTLAATPGIHVELGTWTDHDSFTRAVAPIFTGTTVVPFASLENAALCNSSIPPTLISFTCGGPGANQPVDMSNLGAIQLRLNFNGPTPGADITLGAFFATTVPTPSSSALLSLALVGTGIALRQRQKRPANRPQAGAQ